MKEGVSLLKKELRMIATFLTNADVTQAAIICKKHKIPGRVISVPQKVAAGCGMGFSTTPEYGEKLLAALKSEGVTLYKLHEVEI